MEIKSQPTCRLKNYYNLNLISYEIHTWLWEWEEPNKRNDYYNVSLYLDVFSFVYTPQPWSQVWILIHVIISKVAYSNL